MQHGGSGTGPGFNAHAELLKLQKSGCFPDEPAKKNAHTITVQAARGASNKQACKK